MKEGRRGREGGSEGGGREGGGREGGREGGKEGGREERGNEGGREGRGNEGGRDNKFQQNFPTLYDIHSSWYGSGASVVTCSRWHHDNLCKKERTGGIKY